MPPAIVEIFEKLLLQAGEAIKPSNSTISADVELGALLLGFATSIFNHHKEKMVKVS